jgi:hypothetical protein
MKLLTGHSYHFKTDAELLYIIRDAGEAARCMKDVDAKAEAKYLDQVNDASSIMHARRAGTIRQIVRNPMLVAMGV